MGSLTVFLSVLLVFSLLGLAESAESKERARPKGCRKPNKPEGKTYFKGCDKFTCVKINRKTFVWKPSFASTKCCSFNQTGYRIGSSIESVQLPDMCTTVSLMCKRKEAGADMELIVEDDCPKRPGIMNVITNSSAIIKSPRYPSNYPPNVDECWMRTPSCGYGVKLEFTNFDVLDDDAYITIDPAVGENSKFFGNSFNSARAPPKVINFPADHAVKICFKSGPIVNGHNGFRAEVTQTVKTIWINSPNYPEINDENYMDPPPNGYGPAIHQCWVRSPSLGRALELEFFQFDIHAPLKPTGDWLTIYPEPTSKPLAKYYGVNMDAPEAPPTSTLYQQNEHVTICMKTRSRVDDHKGFVAEAYEATGPSTAEPTADTSSYYIGPEYSTYDYNYYTDY